MLRRLTNRPIARAAVATFQMALQSGGGRRGPPPEDMAGFRGAPPQGMPRGQQAPSQAPPQQQAEDTPPPPPQRPSTPPKFFTSSTSDNGVLTVKWNRPPVNSFNLEFLTELCQWFLWFGFDESVKSVVLTSDIPTVFSAGLDIGELHKPNVDRFKQFWTNLQEFWMILNTFPKPIVAAINGNSPAGGCFIAMCCDYRVMARAPAASPERLYRIGLNETKLGIVAPPWVMGQLSYLVGSRKAERMLQLGETPTADEAATIGLVDVVVDEANVLPTATKEAEKLMTIPNEARWMSKDMMRRELFQFMSTEEERRYDTEFFANVLQNPEVQGNIGKYLDRLKKK